MATVEMLQLTVLYNIGYKSNSLTGPEDRSNFLQIVSNVLDDSNTKMLLNLQQVRVTPPKIHRLEWRNAAHLSLKLFQNRISPTKFTTNILSSPYNINVINIK